MHRKINDSTILVRLMILLFKGRDMMTQRKVGLTIKQITLIKIACKKKKSVKRA